MSEHTPGPWATHAEYCVCKLDELVVGSNRVQAKNDWESLHADARLISAAPELLDALESLRGWQTTAPQGIIDAADAALAKAKGEQG